MSNENSTLGTSEVLDRLKRDIPTAWELAQVVGRWVWITFEGKPADAVREGLTALGFHWNRKRGAWQHPCGCFTRHAPYDPREKYMSISARNVDEKAAA